MCYFNGVLSSCIPYYIVTALYGLHIMWTVGNIANNERNGFLMVMVLHGLNILANKTSTLFYLKAHCILIQWPTRKSVLFLSVLITEVDRSSARSCYSGQSLLTAGRLYILRFVCCNTISVWLPTWHLWQLCVHAYHNFTEVINIFISFEK